MKKMFRGNLGVGLMSGTSSDGITAALVRADSASLKVLRFETRPFGASLRRRLLSAETLTTPELSRLNFEMGLALAESARKISRGARPDFVGSHGHTAWHAPLGRPPHTLQIGEAAFIAEAMRCPVVSNFRAADVASGGEGAPLIAAFDHFLFGRGPLRAVLNIGGIANVSFVGRGKLWSSFDTGPGNCLMDLAVRTATRGSKDKDQNGALAFQGRCDFKKLESLLRLPYFRRPPPKSLERSEFGAGFLSRHFGRVSRENLPDVLAVLSELTARSIARALGRFSPAPAAELVVSGGGALNADLMRRLGQALSPVPVRDLKSYGIAPMAKEAACFAWLAFRALSGVSNNCPRATGARGPRILGQISLPFPARRPLLFDGGGRKNAM